VRTRGKPPMPFLQANPTAIERQTSSLLLGVVRPLEAAALLATPQSSGPDRWRGIALLPLRNARDASGGWQDVGDRLRDLRAVRGTYLRLDLSLAPRKSRGAAQLALTGDDEFVRIARLAAVRHGLHLDEYGLWRWHESDDDDDDDEQHGGHWELVEGENEIRILDEIGLGDVPPPRRNFRFLVGRKRASARDGSLDFGADVGQAASWFVPKRGRPPKNPSASVDPPDSGEGEPPPEGVDVDDVDLIDDVLF